MFKKSFSLIAAVLLLSLAVSSANASLVAQYQFSGNANDSASGFFNATLMGGATTVNDAQMGQVLSLNGTTAWVACPTSFDFVTSTTHKAIMAWVKPNSTNLGLILDLYRNSSSSSGFLLEAAHNPTTWNSRYNTGGSGWADIDSKVSATPGSWVHLALVQDGTKVTYYVNGIVAGQTNNGGTPTVDSPINASIGAYIYGGPSGFFNGRIDDLRIYNNALSQSDIQAIIPEPVTLLLLGVGALMVNRKRKS